MVSTVQSMTLTSSTSTGMAIRSSRCSCSKRRTVARGSCLLHSSTRENVLLGDCVVRWNIQEIVRTDEGDLEYGDVYYGVQTYSTFSRADLIDYTGLNPLLPMQFMTNPQHWAGKLPPPRVTQSDYKIQEESHEFHGHRDTEEDIAEDIVEGLEDAEESAENVMCLLSQTHSFEHSLDNCPHGDDGCFEHFAAMFDSSQFHNDVFIRNPSHRSCSQDRSDLISEEYQIPSEDLPEDVYDERVMAYEGNIMRLQQLWQDSRIVVVPRFLRSDYARRLRDLLLINKFHSSFWQASFWDALTNTAKIIPRSQANEQVIAAWLESQHQRRSQGVYAYSFTRTVTTIDARMRLFYNFAFQEAVEWLQSPATLHLLKEITGNNYQLNTIFFSKYSAGDFLDLHSDSVGVRKIAFVCQLSDEWHVTYGGLLNFVDQDDWQSILKTIRPQFNNFMFFDVSQEVKCDISPLSTH
eukprot:m.315616 g.315616  ORF g.315616 m.315616 type:complete len:465 (-) comp55445_c0_seq8:108-1502(-)